MFTLTGTSNGVSWVAGGGTDEFAGAPRSISPTSGSALQYKLAFTLTEPADAVMVSG